MKYVFTGGGTLGHTNPAIAVAEKIREIDKNADILFILRENGKENDAVRNRNFTIKEIPACGFNSNKAMKAITVNTRALVKCNKIIREFKPDVIFGTGGYVSFAPLLLGVILKIPTFIHESNIVPGRVTKIISRLGGTLLLNYEGTKDRLPYAKQSMIVGNPLLSDFSYIQRNEVREKLHLKNNEILVLSFGGSGGSKKLNDTIIEVMDKYSKNKKQIRHIHATGEKYFNDIANRHPEFAKGINGCQILPKIDNMAVYMQASDILICRCGATTLSEISATGRASILIPSPNVTDNHQFENGKYLSQRNAAILIEEKELCYENLMQKIDLLTNSKSLRKTIENNVKTLSKINSAEAISRIISNRQNCILP